MPCSLTCALLVCGSGRALPFFRDFIVNFVLGNEEGMIYIRSPTPTGLLKRLFASPSFVPCHIH